MKQSARDQNALTQNKLGRDTPELLSEADSWPEAWKTNNYKAYPRFTSIELEPGTNSLLFDMISKRRSTTDFQAKSLDKQEISDLLAYSCGQHEYAKRVYPSAGNRYPIEMYVVIPSGSGGVSSGVYHYNVSAHSLECVNNETPDLGNILMESWGCHAGSLFVMTAVWPRVEVKYKQKAFKMTCLEAGHIAQNLQLVATSLNLKSISLLGQYDDQLEKLLAVDSTIENTLYTVVVGK